MRKYIAEFIGTYFLVLTIGLLHVGIKYGGEFAPIAVGATLLGMIFSMGHVSKAHFNPAITIAFWLRGSLPRREVFPYFIAEFTGATLAAGTAWFIKSGWETEHLWAAPTSDHLVRILMVEFLFTFALAWVIMNVATAKGLAGNQFYGLAIVGVVIGGAYSVGPISGAAFNPAVTLAACFMGLAQWQHIALYFLAQIFAGALAGLGFHKMFPEEG